MTNLINYQFIKFVKFNKFYKKKTIQKITRKRFLKKYIFLEISLLQYSKKSDVDYPTPKVYSNFYVFQRSIKKKWNFSAAKTFSVSKFFIFNNFCTPLGYPFLNAQKFFLNFFPYDLYTNTDLYSGNFPPPTPQIHPKSVGVENFVSKGSKSFKNKAFKEVGNHLFKNSFKKIEGETYHFPNFVKEFFPKRKKWIQYWIFPLVGFVSLTWNPKIQFPNFFEGEFYLNSFAPGTSTPFYDERHTQCSLSFGEESLPYTFGVWSRKLYPFKNEIFKDVKVPILISSRNMDWHKEIFLTSQKTNFFSNFFPKLEKSNELKLEIKEEFPNFTEKMNFHFSFYSSNLIPQIDTTDFANDKVFNNNIEKKYNNEIQNLNGFYFNLIQKNIFSKIKSEKLFNPYKNKFWCSNKNFLSLELFIIENKTSTVQPFLFTEKCSLKILPVFLQTDLTNLKKLYSTLNKKNPISFYNNAKNLFENYLKKKNLSIKNISYLHDLKKQESFFSKNLSNSNKKSSNYLKNFDNIDEFNQNKNPIYFHFLNKEFQSKNQLKEPLIFSKISQSFLKQKIAPFTPDTDIHSCNVRLNFASGSSLSDKALNFPYNGGKYRLLPSLGVEKDSKLSKKQTINNLKFFSKKWNLDLNCLLLRFYKDTSNLQSQYSFGAGYTYKSSIKIDSNNSIINRIENDFKNKKQFLFYFIDTPNPIRTIGNTKTFQISKNKFNKFARKIKYFNYKFSFLQKFYFKDKVCILNNFSLNSSEKSKQKSYKNRSIYIDRFLNFYKNRNLIDNFHNIINKKYVRKKNLIYRNKIFIRSGLFFPLFDLYSGNKKFLKLKAIDNSRNLKINRNSKNFKMTSFNFYPVPLWGGVGVQNLKISQGSVNSINYFENLFFIEFWKRKIKNILNFYIIEKFFHHSIIGSNSIYNIESIVENIDKYFIKEKLKLKDLIGKKNLRTKSILLIKKDLNYKFNNSGVFKKEKIFRTLLSSKSSLTDYKHIDFKKKFSISKKINSERKKVPNLSFKQKRILFLTTLKNLKIRSLPRSHMKKILRLSQRDRRTQTSMGYKNSINSNKQKFSNLLNAKLKYNTLEMDGKVSINSIINRIENKLLFNHYSFWKIDKMKPKPTFKKISVFFHSKKRKDVSNEISLNKVIQKLGFVFYPDCFDFNKDSTKKVDEISSLIKLKKRTYAKTQKYFQKKRRKKKLKLENRRRKKRKRFYPRPIWLQYNLYRKFVNNRYNKKFTNFEPVNFGTPLGYKFKLLYPKNFEKFISHKPKGVEGGQSSTPPGYTLSLNFPEKKRDKKFRTFDLIKKDKKDHKLKSFILRNNKQKWGNFQVDTIQIEKNSLKKYLLATSIPVYFTKNNYKISNQILNDFMPLYWKSYWLRHHLNPYMKRIRKNLNYQKLISFQQEKSSFFYQEKLLNNLLGIFRLNQSDQQGNYQSKIFNNEKIHKFQSINQNSKKIFLEKTPTPYTEGITSGVRRTLHPTPRCTGVKGGIAFYSNKKTAFQVMDDFHFSQFHFVENMRLIREHDRILFDRISEIIKNIKSNINLDGQNSIKSYKLPKSKYNLINSSPKTTQTNSLLNTLKSSIFQQLDPNFSFFSAFNLISLQKNTKNISGSNISSSSIFKPFNSNATLRVLWSFNKSNLFSFKEKNFLKNLWETSKNREQSKSNQTKKFLKKMKYSFLPQRGTNFFAKTLPYKISIYNYYFNKFNNNKNEFVQNPKSKISLSKNLDFFHHISFKKFKNIQKKVFTSMNFRTPLGYKIFKIKKFYTLPNKNMYRCNNDKNSIRIVGYESISNKKLFYHPIPIKDSKKKKFNEFDYDFSINREKNKSFNYSTKKKKTKNYFLRNSIFLKISSNNDFKKSTLKKSSIFFWWSNKNFQVPFCFSFKNNFLNSSIYDYSLSETKNRTEEKWFSIRPLPLWGRGRDFSNNLFSIQNFKHIENIPLKKNRKIDYIIEKKKVFFNSFSFLGTKFGKEKFIIGFSIFFHLCIFLSFLSILELRNLFKFQIFLIYKTFNIYFISLFSFYQCIENLKNQITKSIYSISSLPTIYHSFFYKNLTNTIDIEQKYSPFLNSKFQNLKLNNSNRGFFNRIPKSFSIMDRKNEIDPFLYYRNSRFKSTFITHTPKVLGSFLDNKFFSISNDTQSWSIESKFSIWNTRFRPLFLFPSLNNSLYLNSFKQSFLKSYENISIEIFNGNVNKLFYSFFYLRPKNNILKKFPRYFNSRNCSKNSHFLFFIFNDFKIYSFNMIKTNKKNYKIEQKNSLLIDYKIDFSLPIYYRKKLKGLKKYIRIENLAEKNIPLVEFVQNLSINIDLKIDKFFKRRKSIFLWNKITNVKHTTFSILFLTQKIAKFCLSNGLQSIQLSYKIILKTISFVESFLLVIYKFLEKPADLMIESIAQIFLIEWMSNIYNFMPESLDQNIWQSFQKFIRPTRIFGLFFQSFSSLIPMNFILSEILSISKLDSRSFYTSLIHKTDFQTNNYITAIYSLNSSFEKPEVFHNLIPLTLEGLNSSAGIIRDHNLSMNRFSLDPFQLTSLSFSFVFIQSFSRIFLKWWDSLLKPDMDLYSRQKKGIYFMNIWGEIFIQAAEKYQMNVNSFSTNTLEQEKFMERLLKDPEIFSEKKISNFQNKKSIYKFLKNSFKNSRRIEKKQNNHSHFQKFESSFSVQQHIIASCFGGQSTESDLFLDISPPKSFQSIYSFLPLPHTPKVSGTGSPVSFVIGPILCEVYSGLFSKKVSKNILLITKTDSFQKNTNTTTGSFFIQALAGETEMKLMIDNAKRYSAQFHNKSIGMRLLKDVFMSIALQTPSFFLMEDIHFIGEKRAMLIGNGAEENKRFNSINLEEDEVHFQNQSIYHFSRNKILASKKCFLDNSLNSSNIIDPLNKTFFNKKFYKTFGSDFSYSQSDSEFSTYVGSKMEILGWSSSFTGLVSKSKKQKKHPLPLNFIEKIIQNPSNFLSIEKSNKTRKIPSISRLEKKSEELFAPPSTSPFTILILKNQKKTKTKKTYFLSWTHLNKNQFSRSENSSSPLNMSQTIRMKIAELADMTLRNFSLTIDMITDLLVIVDSVRSNRGFIVFATTPIPAVLDPALRRPGRFDETLSLPEFSTIEKKVSFLPRNIIQDFYKNKTLNRFYLNNKSLDFFQKIQNSILFDSFFLFNRKSEKYSKNFLLNSNNKTISFIQISKTKTTSLSMNQSKNKLRKMFFLTSSFIGDFLIQSDYLKNQTNKYFSQNVIYRKNKDQFSLFFVFFGSNFQYKDLICLFLAPKVLQFFYSFKLKNTKIDIHRSNGATKLKEQSSTPFGGMVLSTENQNIFYNLGDTASPSKDFIFSILQKRYLGRKNFILSKLFSTPLGYENNFGSLNDPPGPPISEIFMPAKKFEAFKLTEKDFIFKNSFSIYEKINSHQKQRFLKKLYNQPIQLYFKSHIQYYKNSSKKTKTLNSSIYYSSKKEKSDLSTFVQSFKELGSLNTVSINSPILKNISSSNYYYKTRFLMRHRFWLTNQWSNAQLPEHNMESTISSDVDWRSMYIQSIKSKKFSQNNLSKIDYKIDFSDVDQYYNPRIRKWFLSHNFLPQNGTASYPPNTPVHLGVGCRDALPYTEGVTPLGCGIEVKNYSNKDGEHVSISEDSAQNQPYYLNKLTFENIFTYEMYYHFLMETFYKTYNYFDQNRELLDYFIFAYLLKGSILKVNSFFLLARFYKK